MIWAAIFVLFLPLATLPLVVTRYFQHQVKAQRKREMLDELKSRGAWKTADLPLLTVRESEVAESFEQYYKEANYWWPAGLLTFVYLIGASWGAAFLASLSDTGTTWPYSQRFITGLMPVLIAFASVFLFNVQHTLRRLFQADLTPKVFWLNFYRTLLVLGLTSAIAYGMRGETMTFSTGLFFALGFLVTETLAAFLVWAQRALQRLFYVNDTRVTERRLTLIQGINIWNAYRLEEEGIENVQQLATADVITLAVKIHYDLKMLIDWVDQAILIHRLGTPEQAMRLREQALISSAIDMAWMAPDNGGEDDDDMAPILAPIIGVHEKCVRQFMNSLFQDDNVQMLWYLWQARPDYQRGGKRLTRQKRDHESTNGAQETTLGPQETTFVK